MTVSLGAVVTSMALGPDGNIWYTNSGDTIGMYDVTTGVTSDYTAPYANVGAIAAGKDGNVWFTALSPGGSPALIGDIGLTSARRATVFRSRRNPAIRRSATASVWSWW